MLTILLALLVNVKYFAFQSQPGKSCRDLKIDAAVPWLLDANMDVHLVAVLSNFSNPCDTAANRG